MLVPVLEIGGTHVTAAALDPDTWRWPAPPVRLPLEAHAGAAELLDTIARAAASVPALPATTWGVAMPDPFDYRRGVALFAGVGKFDSLYGVDVGAELSSRLGGPMHFINDADAFILGEWVHGVASGMHRCTGLTLGTGVGSGWLVDGVVADPGVPAGGRAHHLHVEGVELEEVMSRRAVRRAYAAQSGDTDADVLLISTRARDGDVVAQAVLGAALRGLGAALGPALTAFGAELLVIGGSMAGSWDLFEPWFSDGAASAGVGLPPIQPAADAEHAPLIGAAAAALDGVAG
jgi:glucokinase